jgi:hypothetical protein
VESSFGRPRVRKTTMRAPGGSTMAKHRGSAFHHCHRRASTRRQHYVAVLAPFRLSDTNDALGDVDIADLEPDDLAGVQAAAERERDASFQRPCHCQQAPGRVRACDALPGTAARSDVAGRTLLASALGSLRRVEVGRHRFGADRLALSLRPDQGLDHGEVLGMARRERLAPPELAAPHRWSARAAACPFVITRKGGLILSGFLGDRSGRKPLCISLPGS